MLANLPMNLRRFIQWITRPIAPITRTATRTTTRTAIRTATRITIRTTTVLRTRARTRPTTDLRIASKKSR
jgi:hypothetical protein